MKIILSVVIPVYNGEKTIERCIKSIIPQLTESMELVIIDDGSSDHSFNIVDEYRRKYTNRIRIIQQENSGAAVARNNGIDEATGAWIMFVDQDDYIDIGYFNCFLENRITQDGELADVVVGGYRRTNDNHILFEVNGTDNVWYPYTVMAPWAHLYRRSFLIENNIHFLESSLGEDVYFNLSVYYKARHIRILNYCGYNWYDNGISVSNTSQKSFLKNNAFLDILDKMATVTDVSEKIPGFFFVRYIIWYLLFAGRSASQEQFLLEYRACFDWLKKHNIPDELPERSLLSCERTSARVPMEIFLKIHKQGLMKPFAHLYARGNEDNYVNEKATAEAKLPENLMELHTFVVCAYKESPYLKECLESIKTQRKKSRVLICTSTDNAWIRSLAKEYGVEVRVNHQASDLAGDWNFAYQQAETPYVTLAHQDDVYDPDYAETAVDMLLKYDREHPLLFFCHYYELRDDKRVFDNLNLHIKRKLLQPLTCAEKRQGKWKNRVLSLGNPICCPAITYVKTNLPKQIFHSGMKSNVDWEMTEMISHMKGSFLYCQRQMMGHRIHSDSTTTEIIENHGRKEEDLKMLEKFWPDSLARIISFFYGFSEKSNNIKEGCVFISTQEQAARTERKKCGFY